MLDATTKRNIDAARNVLVGKVPDPKAQVEQITTALIYKFMDDLDKEAVELGGKVKYFAGDYEQYSWSKVLDTRLSGQARLNLYVQAISNIPKNPDLPQLFRDIFKGAFLPYNDPQTLSLFLKEINNFTYGHSEELGNAFEYLLSVLGSQGDAGQFRTPRHIIDFIVEVVDPQKSDTILDPACGTAGFLISAYKHIRKNNSSNYQPQQDSEVIVGESASDVIVLEKEFYDGDKLNPQEWKKLTENIQGYDISPDMVKLSLVNLYLHGFGNPNIYEYDTLTSEERWGESFDVMLANPPFMTPKGGIRPHKRFQVQANRSEVLFVDYILEHLNLKGRAGIIVPEGVIFKSDNAYKQLRKLLVEDGLFAVASLPPGVFNPYSGVKTSILFFDNEVAKLTDEILFINIENDGFGLGAQRRKIKQDDLPEAQAVLLAWKHGEKQESNLALWVKKEQLGEDGEYNLTGERYRANEVQFNRIWSMVELGEVLEYEQPTKYLVESENYDDSFKTPVLTAGKSFILGYTNERTGILEHGLPVIIFDDFTTSSKLVGFPFKVKSSAMKILRAKENKADIRFVYYVMQQIDFDASRHKRYWISQYSKIKIPLPPPRVQREIVEQIEVKQATINAAESVIENLDRERRYFGRQLRKLGGVEWVKLGEIFEKVNDNIDPQRETGKTEFIGLENIESNTGRLIGETTAEITTIKSTKTKFRNGDILYGKLRPNLNKVWLADRDGICSTDIYVLRSKPKELAKEVYALFFRSDLFNAQVLTGLKGAQLPRVGFNHLASLNVPVFTNDINEKLLYEIETQEKTLEANSNLISTMEKKIATVVDEVWRG